MLVSLISQENGPIDNAAWTNFLAFDSMDDVGISENFACLTNKSENPTTQRIREYLDVIGIVVYVP